MPPREHGGNCDIKDLSRGSKIYFPVYVPGGGLSMGDLHFSQGDGEITFCGAIEMAGWLHMQGRHHQGRRRQIRHQEPDVQAVADHAELQGLSDLRGHLGRRGRQAALPRRSHRLPPGLPERDRVSRRSSAIPARRPIRSSAPRRARATSRGVVDVPNACATLWLPTEIFDFDIMPSSAGPIKHIKGDIQMPLSPGQVIPARQGCGTVAYLAAPHPPSRIIRSVDRARKQDARLRISLQRLRPVHRHAADGRMRRCRRTARDAKAESPRVILTAPSFFCMPSDKRKALATNERSANAPKTLGRVQGLARPRLRLLFDRQEAGAG